MAQPKQGKTYTKTEVRIIQELVNTTVASFTEKWNKHNPTDKIEIRLVSGKSKQREEDGAIQFSIAMELKHQGLWTVLLRTIAWANVASQEDLALLTTELYRSMFVEIMHTGLLTSLIQTTQQNGAQSNIDTSQTGRDPETPYQGYGGKNQIIH